MIRAGKCGITGKPSAFRRLRGGDHVLDRRAFDMGDVDAGAGGQQVAEILDLFGGARHDLDRVAVKKRLDLAVAGG